MTIENDGQVVAGNKNNAAWVRTSRKGMDIGGFKQNYKKTRICISEKSEFSSYDVDVSFEKKGNFTWKISFGDVEKRRHTLRSVCSLLFKILTE